MTTIKRKSRILNEVHEMAADLHEIGLIDKRRMREFDALCKLDVQEMPPHKIKRLREEAYQSSCFCRGIEHESVNDSKMGNRRQKAQWTLSKTVDEPY